MKLTEGDLEFDFAGAITATKFDDGVTHVASSIQPVDFIVEYPDRFKFIEVKDPDDPGAANVPAFVEKLKTGKLVRSLAGKYRDTYFFHIRQGHPSKNIEYIVLLSMKSLDDALLLTKQDQLKKSMPYSHPSWSQNSVDACVILNVEHWKKRYGATSIKRLSDP